MDNRVSDRQGIGHQTCSLYQWHIKRCDHCDNTKRFTDGHRERTGAIRWDRLATHIATQTGGGTDHRQAFSEFKHCLLHGRADLVDQAIYQIFLTCFHDLCDPQEPALALGWRCFFVRCEGCLCCRHCIEDIFGRSFRSKSIMRVVKRVKHFEHCTSRCIDPLPCNKVLQGFTVCPTIHEKAPFAARYLAWV